MYYQYDLKQGVLRYWKSYLLPVILTVVGCISFKMAVKDEIAIGMLERAVTFPDLLLYLWKGDKPNILYKEGEFHFPFLWIITQLQLSYIVGRYPTSELYDNHGAYVLIKGGSRFRWLQSKCLVILINCLLFYGVTVLFAFIFSELNGFSMQFLIEPSASPLLLTSENNLTGVNLILLLLLPLLASIALSYVQLAITLFIDSTVGFTFVLGICAASIYFESIFIFPNCSALSRNALFNAGTIDTINAIILLFSIIVTSIFICHIYFGKTDIIKKGKSV